MDPLAAVVEYALVLFSRVRRGAPTFWSGPLLVDTLGVGAGGLGPWVFLSLIVAPVDREALSSVPRLGQAKGNKLLALSIKNAHPA